MSARAARPHSLDVDSLLYIDRCCVRFEKALRGDTPESIDALLSEAPATLAPALFEELLALELAALSSRGEAPPKRHYLHRFPTFAGIVDALYAEFGIAGPEQGEHRSLGVIDGYLVQERLARGGMGVVYRALDTRLNRTVALKLLSADHLNAAQMARFEAESRALARLEHPNILRIHHFGQWHDQPYHVLEFASGGTLADRLRQGPSDLDACLAVMSTLAGAAAYIHAQGLVHRDLKPSNILFTEEGVLKIGDFGLVRGVLEDGALTRGGDRVGTPAYMAPEQLNADMGEVGPQADIFALGVIMHHLLTGRLPYGDVPMEDVLSLVAGSRELALGDLEAPGIPAGFARVCRRCLRKRPAHRYPGAAALEADLARLRDGLSIGAWPLLRSRLALQARGLATTALIFALGVTAAWRALPPDQPAAGPWGSEVIGALEPTVWRRLDPSASPAGEARVLTLLGADAAAELRLDAPQGLALLEERYLAIADTLHHRVLLLDLQTGDVGRLAGNGEASHAGDGGPARDATLNLPTGLYFDGRGQLYVADKGNHAIRVIDADGTMRALTGVEGCQDSFAPSSRPFLCYPGDVAATPAGDYYIADTGNGRVRHGGPNALPATLLSRQDALARNDYAPFPQAIEAAGDSLYVLDAGSGTLRQWSAAHDLRILAGGFQHAAALATDTAGNVYVGDHSTQPITRIRSDGHVEALSQDQLFPDAGAAYSVDALAVDPHGRVFFTSRSDNSLRVMIPPGQGAAVPMTPRHAVPAVDRQPPPLERLQRQQSYSYVGVSVGTLLTGLTAGAGLDLLVDADMELGDRIDMTDYALSRYDMLAVACFYVGATCGIDGNRLVAAPAAAYAGLTGAVPLRLPDAEALLGNAGEMPPEWREDLRRTLVFPDRPGATLEDFLRLVEEMTHLRFRMLESVMGFRNAPFNPIGPYEVGGLLVPMILANDMDFRYDAASATLLVDYLGKAP